jgi:hypothetical protein
MDELCPECRKFDEAMNGQHGEMASCDVLVICNCSQPKVIKQEDSIKFMESDSGNTSYWSCCQLEGTNDWVQFKCDPSKSEDLKALRNNPFIRESSECFINRD